MHRLEHCIIHFQMGPAQHLNLLPNQPSISTSWFHILYQHTRTNKLNLSSLNIPISPLNPLLFCYILFPRPQSSWVFRFFTSAES